MLIFGVPPGVAAFVLATSTRRTARIVSGIIAVVAGLFDVVIGVIAVANDAPEALPLVPAGILMALGGMRALTKPGPRPPGR
jgi:hypothetical protein